MKPNLQSPDRNKTTASLWAASLGLAFLAPAALAGNAMESATTPEEKGLQIAIAADARDSGWSDWTARARMVLRNRQGQTSTRELRLQALEQEADGDKRLIVFDEPRDVKGTAFLVFTKKRGNDDQWLYLPALKRVKRIASNNQAGPFVGSEFAYEDLSSQEVEKYSYKYLRDEDVDGQACYVIERYPVDENSGYTRQVVWLDQQEYRVLKTEYYDRKSELLKTFVAEGYRSYGDNYWRATRYVMVNHQTGKSTDLLWEDYTFTQGLTDRQFDQRSLRNSR